MAEPHGPGPGPVQQGAGCRVLLVMGPSTGGIGRHVAMLAKGLPSQGVDATVCAPAGALPDSDGVRLVTAPIGSRQFTDLRQAVRTLRQLARSADVVHAHGLRAAVLAAVALPGRPLVATWHNAPVQGAGPRPLVHAALERLAARRSRVTLAVSPDLAARARRAGGRDVRVGFIPAPTTRPAVRSPDQMRAALELADSAVVVAVGRLQRQKRFDLLVEAAAGWADAPDAPILLVAGDGDERGRLERLSRERRAAVRWLGHRSDITDLLGLADVAVVSSDWEGCPLIVQEALRAGVPLVATAVGGIPDLVGSAALLAPADSPRQLRQAVLRVLHEPGLAQRLRTEGPVQAASWPTIDAVVSSIAQLYLTLDHR